MLMASAALLSSVCGVLTTLLAIRRRRLPDPIPKENR